MRNAKDIQDATQEAIDRATRLFSSAQREQPKQVTDLMNAVASIQLTAVCELLVDIRDQNAQIIELLSQPITHYTVDRQAMLDTIQDVFKKATE